MERESKRDMSKVLKNSVNREICEFLNAEKQMLICLRSGLIFKCPYKISLIDFLLKRHLLIFHSKRGSVIINYLKQLKLSLVCNHVTYLETLQ